MAPKSLRIAYWAATIVFALLLAMDGIGGITRAEAGVEALQHLGYPLYLLPAFGIAKVLAAIAVLQTKFRTPKEWAFAGWAFTCVGAFVSRAAVGDGVELIFPVVFLAIMLVPYGLWLRARQAGIVT
ncbi:MAG: DoxX family protein [Gammaproteobacteria bacterium]